jgi:penicillin amidase
MIVRAMTDAIQFLTDSLGTEPINWRWENMHQVKFETPYFSTVAESQKDGYLSHIVTYMLNRGPYGTRGHTTSPVSGQYDWSRPYRQVAGATWRRVVDLSNTSQSWSILPGGQSGNALSPAYDNQLDLWLEGKYRIFEHNSEVRFREDMPALTLNPGS